MRQKQADIDEKSFICYLRTKSVTCNEVQNDGQQWKVCPQLLGVTRRGMLPSLNRIQRRQHIQQDPGYRFNDGGHANILTLHKIVSILLALAFNWGTSL